MAYANKDLKIDAEFEKLIPPLTTEEFETLKINCLNDGIREPLAVWNNLIIDGHNRFKISRDNGWLDFETIDYTERLPERIDVLLWMLNNQRGRRNLNNYDKGLLALKLQDLLKIKGKENMSKAGEGLPNRVNVNSQKEAAAAFNIGHNTLNKVKQIEENATEEQKQALKNGTKTVDKVYNEVKADKRTKEAKNKINDAKNGVIPSSIKILEGDLFNQVQNIPDGSIDLLCTDPPYFVLGEDWDAFDSLETFMQFTNDWLTAVLPKVNPKTGRIYISFAPDYKYNLYGVLAKNAFFGFKFASEIIWVKKNDVKMFNRHSYRINYEPIFYLYGTDAKQLNFDDPYIQKDFNIQSNVWEIATPQSNFKEGKIHPAQKPLELYRRIILTGSNPGDNVLDCFGGSGTTGVICKETGRNCILIEKNPDYIDIIKGRIADGVG